MEKKGWEFLSRADTSQPLICLVRRENKIKKIYMLICVFGLFFYRRRDKIMILALTSNNSQIKPATYVCSTS